MLIRGRALFRAWALIRGNTVILLKKKTNRQTNKPRTLQVAAFIVQKEYLFVMWRYQSTKKLGILTAYLDGPI